MGMPADRVMQACQPSGMPSRGTRIPVYKEALQCDECPNQMEDWDYCDAGLPLSRFLGSQSWLWPTADASL